MRKFTVNEKEYTARPFDFNLICDLEEMGVSMQDTEKKPMSLVRAYFGLCAGKSNEYAGKEMEEHIIKGGSFDNVMDVISKEMDESDFFRKLSQTEETKTTENTKKTSKKSA